MKLASIIQSKQIGEGDDPVYCFTVWGYHGTRNLPTLCDITPGMFAKSVTNLGGVSGIQVNFDLLKDTHPLNVTSTTGILLGSIKRGKEGGQRCEQQESEEFTCANKHPIEQNMDDAL